MSHNKHNSQCDSIQVIFEIVDTESCSTHHKHMKYVNIVLHFSSKHHLKFDSPSRQAPPPLMSWSHIMLPPYGPAIYGL